MPEGRVVPVQRVPNGQGIPEDWVQGPHGHGEDGVERRDEEDDEPHHAGKGKGGPEPAPLADHSFLVRLPSHGPSRPAGPSTTLPATACPPPVLAAQVSGPCRSRPAR